MKKMSFSKKQQGLNLIELLLVLAIVVAIAVAAFVIYPRVQASRSASTNSQIISAALAQTQSIFQNGQYAKLNNLVASRSEIFPDSFVIGSTGILANEFAPDATNNVTINGSESDGTTATDNSARYVTMVYGDVPSNVCIKLIPGLAANFGRISIGATDLVNKFDGSAANDVLDEAAMVTNCNATTGVVDIEMTAR